MMPCHQELSCLTVCTIWQGNDYRDTMQGKIQHEPAFTKQLLDHKAIKDERCNWQPLFQAAMCCKVKGTADKAEGTVTSSPAFLCKSVIFMQWEKSQEWVYLYLSHSVSLLLPNLSYLIATSHNPLARRSSGLKSGPCAQITLALTLNRCEASENIREKSEEFH